MSRHALSCLQNRRNFLRLIGERRQAFGEPEAQVTREGGARSARKITTSHTSTVPITLINEYHAIIECLSTKA